MTVDDAPSRPQQRWRTADEVTTRLMRPGDEQAVLDVYVPAFGRWPTTQITVGPIEYMRWFLEEHEATKGTFGVAEIDGRIVAVHGWLERRVKLPERTVWSNVGGAATAVHPDFHGQGIHTIFTDALAEFRRSTILVKFTGRFTAQDREIVVPVGSGMAVWLRVFRPRAAAATKTDGGSRLRELAGALGYTVLQAWGRLRSRRARPPQGLRIQPVERLDERFDAFWEVASEPWDFIPVRSAEFLNWRYLDPRAGEYTVLVAEESEGEIAGYVVLKIEDGRGHVVDLLTLPERPEIVRALVDEALRWFAAQETDAVECWLMQDHPYAQAIREAGFVRLRARSNELTFRLKIGGRTPEDRAELGFLAHAGAAIHIVEGDSDTI